MKTCTDCGRTDARGYGRTHDGWYVCYECIAIRDAEEMRRSGCSHRLPLYLVREGATFAVTNWPNTLRFDEVTVRHGDHNIAGKRIDAWFAGPDGHIWHGVNIGNNTQVLHAKRTKQLAQ